MPKSKSSGEKTRMTRLKKEKFVILPDGTGVGEPLGQGMIQETVVGNQSVLTLPDGRVISQPLSQTKEASMTDSSSDTSSTDTSSESESENDTSVWKWRFSSKRD